MALVVITIQDADDDDADVKVLFEPMLPNDDSKHTTAQVAAINALAALQGDVEPGSLKVRSAIPE